MLNVAFIIQPSRQLHKPTYSLVCKWRNPPISKDWFSWCAAAASETNRRGPREAEIRVSVQAGKSGDNKLN